MNSREVGLELPQCTECGACCAIGPRWAEVTESDFVRLGRDESLVEPGDIEPYSMRVKIDGWECVALKGEVGGLCSCGVYENRPEACRDFVRWSPGCVYAVGLYRLGQFTW